MIFLNVFIFVFLLFVFLVFYILFKTRNEFVTLTRLIPDKDSMMDSLKSKVDSTLKESDEDAYIDNLLGNNTKDKNSDVFYVDFDLNDIKYKEVVMRVRKSDIFSYYSDPDVGLVLLSTKNNGSFIIKESTNLVDKKISSIFALQNL